MTKAATLQQKNAAKKKQPNRSKKTASVTEPVSFLSSISLDQAQSQIDGWRSYPIDPKGFHGFLINTKDILGLANVIITHIIEGRTILGVRAYLGTELPGSKYEGKPSLIFVAVEEDPKNEYGRDIYDRTNSKEANNSGIFNFTQPCPTCCEPGSDLVNIPGQKTKLQLQGLSKKKRKHS
jgi:hypothetical protein